MIKKDNMILREDSQSPKSNNFNYTNERNKTE